MKFSWAVKDAACAVIETGRSGWEYEPSELLTEAVMAVVWFCEALMKLSWAVKDAACVVMESSRS